MSIPALDKVIDERFRIHRLRSTSIGGQACAAVALGLFAWRYYVDHRLSWDLFAVGVTMVAVKVAVMIWYSLKD